MVSLFLSQSYNDAWEDYTRALTKEKFVRWDYVILTASNEQQAEGFSAQIQARLAAGRLPETTKYAVLPDPEGKRVGSGGATLNVIKYIAEQEENADFGKLRILVIHSGGDSKRVPQYSALGKLFSPVPHELPGGERSTLFDEFMFGMSGVPGRIKNGMLLLSGDVLLLQNSLQIDFPGNGAAAVSFKENVETGKNHGVFLMGKDGNVARFLHKQTTETLKEYGAVNENGCVDIDTGAVIFSAEILDALYGLISTEENGQRKTDARKFGEFVNETVRLSLYGDFLYPLASESTLEDYYREKPEGNFCDELTRAREKVWQALGSFQMKLLRLSPAKFVHFGTTKEVIGLMTAGVENYKYLGWGKIINSSVADEALHERLAVNNSVVDSGVKTGRNNYFESAYVHSGAETGDNVILSYIDLQNGKIPDNTVLHGLKQKDGKFAVRIYGIDDNPKAKLEEDGCIFGVRLSDILEKTGIKTEDIWEGNDYSLWNARLYAAEDTVDRAVDAALEFYALVQACADTGSEETGKRKELAGKFLARDRKSLCSGFNEADNHALLAWDRRMQELVKMDRVEAVIKNRGTVGDAEGILDKAPLTKIQLEWLEKHVQGADFEGKIKLYYFIGKLLGDVWGEKYLDLCFQTIQETVLDSTINGLHVNEACRIVKDEHTVRLPLRVNFAGGWTDTCPQACIEGGTVLNAAISLNGELPVCVTLRRISEKKIIFDSRDMDSHGEFESLAELQDTGNPYDPFALQKAALIACGIIPAEKTSGERTLAEVLDRLGGGIFMSTEVTGVPKGSGLGTSSILAGACVKALFEFMGIPYSEDDLYDHVLCMEQIMSTGGGWQDQVGGLTFGFKLIRSKAGLHQKLQVKHIALSEETMSELNERFALIYTGQRRLARNLLRDVVGRYIGNEPSALKALEEMQKLAPLMIFELERDNVDGFAKLLGEHWELSKMLDMGSTNTCIDQILLAVDDLVDGKMICGAGGGGFLQVVLKKDIGKKALSERLKAVFQDSGVDVWESRFV